MRVAKTYLVENGRTVAYTYAPPKEDAPRRKEARNETADDSQLLFTGLALVFAALSPTASAQTKTPPSIIRT